MMWQNLLYTSLSLIIMLLIGVVIVSIINVINLKKQKKHYQTIHEELKVHKKVIILNAIYGQIVAIRDDTVDVKIKSGEVMEVSRYSISKILN